MQDQSNILKPMTPTSQVLGKFGVKKIWLYVIGALLVVVVGVGIAWMLSRSMFGETSGSAAAPGVKVTSTEAGVLDPSVKYDTATGVLQTGGIGNEGTYHLVREGGTQHYVYLTSSVVDLSPFVNKNVQVWGETLASKTAPWLMDVAKIQVTQ
jgi:hypothetical protein